MTKKKRNHPDVEEVLSRPWCYYCERDFDDLKILINHQKAKHFKCERCGRRLNTAGGLSVHMSQVHKENLTAVDNALPNRAGLDIEIFGMEGIPDDIAQQHHQRVLTNFHQDQAARQNGGGAQNGANATKKPKVEAVSDIKARLAAHKAAKLAAERGEGESSGGNTPNTPAAVQPVQAQPPMAAPQAYPQYQQPYAAPPTNGSYAQPPAFNQPGVSAPYQAPPAYPHATSPPNVPGYGQAPTPQPGHPPFHQQSYAQPPGASFPPHPSPGYPPQPSYTPPFQNPYPGQPFASQNGGPPRPFGAVSPMPGFPQQPPHLQHQPGQNGNFPAPVRTGSVSLPSAPGLPQRPAFGAPPVNAFQFQQMHQGQLPPPQSHNAPPQYNPAQPNGVAPPQQQVVPPPQSAPVESTDASSLDDLIANASKQADANVAATTAKTAAQSVAPPQENAEEKTAKKEKAAEKEKPKTTRLVYSDNDTSPEEKMAMLPKYAFTAAQRSIAV